MLCRNVDILKEPLIYLKNRRYIRRIADISSKILSGVYSAGNYNKKRCNLLPIDCISFFSSLAQYTRKLSRRALKYQVPYVLRAHLPGQGGRS